MAGVQLYDYQLEAVQKMRLGCILCGGVGSGKSRTGLAFYYQMFDGKLNTEEYVPMVEPEDLYIITTARKRDTGEWDEELAPFFMSTDESLDLYNHKVVIDSWNNIGKYVGVKRAFFIFDEQRVVGNGSWVKDFLRITKENDWILLSATPGDCWTDYIPVFIANGFYKNRTQFNNEHVVYSRFSKYPKIDRYLNTGRLIRLRERILVDMDFERKTIPHHENIYVGFDQRKYKDICMSRWNPWEGRPIETASEFCSNLRRVVNADESRQQEVLDMWPPTVVRTATALRVRLAFVPLSPSVDQSSGGLVPPLFFLFERRIFACLIFLKVGEKRPHWMLWHWPRIFALKLQRS